MSGGRDAIRTSGIVAALLAVALAGCLGGRPVPKRDAGAGRGGAGGQAGEGGQAGDDGPGQGGDGGQGGDAGQGAGGESGSSGAGGSGPPPDGGARDAAPDGPAGRGGAGGLGGAAGSSAGGVGGGSVGGAGGATCTRQCSGKCAGPDGCGGTCPDTCISPQSCGGGGSPSVCGCRPQCTGVCSGPDGCGGTCRSSCAAPETCGGGGNPLTCGCTPSCSGKCAGSDGCGGTCPDDCVAPRVCGGAGTPNVCGELPGCTTAIGSPRWRQLPEADPWPQTGQRLPFVHDTGRDRFVLFHWDGIWEWNPSTGAWVSRGTTPQPSARSAPGMAYDVARKRVLMFGGWDQGYFNDTWEWDGAAGTWTQRNPSRTPPASSTGGMAYDPIRSRMVLVPGYNADQPTTWEWDGSNWSEKSNADHLPPQGDKFLVWDGPQQRMIMVTPYDGKLFYWRPSDSSWIVIPTGCGPSMRFQASVTFAPDRGEILYYGGQYSEQGMTSTYYRELWRWAPDGFGWRKYNMSGSWPSVSFDGSLLWDGVRQRALIFSGATGDGSGPSKNLWELKF